MFTHIALVAALHTTADHTGTPLTPGNIISGFFSHKFRQPNPPSRPYQSEPYRPYGLYDSVTPGMMPHGNAQGIYADGPYAYNSTPSGHPKTIWIDVNGSRPDVNALDVEPGDATPDMAGPWASQAHNNHPHEPTIIYTSLSEWSAAKASVTASHVPDVRWWIADPTNSPHLVPGSDATQWYWGKNVDISATTPQFWKG